MYMLILPFGLSDRTIELDTCYIYHHFCLYMHVITISWFFHNRLGLKISFPLVI
ncbi:hypothetical protein Syun_020808 [Stephania yunnanensis]|uniref:Uncharacterized protein n=1 Tax=Stephania yunnanensis TaxID=152371 RepID=A0AAP0NRR5_9MAGN